MSEMLSIVEPCQKFELQHFGRRAWAVYAKKCKSAFKNRCHNVIRS